jgi:hypothetical protein
MIDRSNLDDDFPEDPAKFLEEAREAIGLGPLAETKAMSRTTTDGIPGYSSVQPGISKKAAFNHARHSWLDNVGLDRKLTAAALRIAILIWKYSNYQKGYAFPSLTHIVTTLGMHKSTVTRSMKLLEQRGWLNVSRRRGSGPNRRDHVNQYRLAMGKMDDDAPPLPRSR